MKIIIHLEKPNQKVIQIEKSDCVTPQEIVSLALNEKAVDCDPSSVVEAESLVWVQYGDAGATAYRIDYLRKWHLQGAKVDQKRGLFIPNKQELKKSRKFSVRAE